MEGIKEIKVRIKTLDPMLGTSSANTLIHDEYIAQKSLNDLGENRTLDEAEARIKEELDALSTSERIEKATTIFPKDENGVPFLWDYQLRGFIKEAIGAIRGVSGSACSAIKAYKKAVDNFIFVEERRIPIEFEGELKTCQRPLRAQTAQGERVSLASSEEIPAGAELAFTVQLLNPSHEKAVLEALDYGILKGLGQWRNSGKGRFRVLTCTVDGKAWKPGKLNAWYSERENDT